MLAFNGSDLHQKCVLLELPNTKCLHNRPDGYILNDRHYVCERHHACAEVSSKPNKKDGDQTCKKSGCLSQLCFSE